MPPGLLSTLAGGLSISQCGTFRGHTYGVGVGWRGGGTRVRLARVSSVTRDFADPIELVITNQCV